MSPGQLHVYSEHALLAHKLALLRDRRTRPGKFAKVLKEASLMLLSYATHDLPIQEVRVVTPVAPTRQNVIAKRIGFAPILRASPFRVWAMVVATSNEPLSYASLRIRSSFR